MLRLKMLRPMLSRPARLRTSARDDPRRKSARQRQRGRRTESMDEKVVARERNPCNPCNQCPRTMHAVRTESTLRMKSTVRTSLHERLAALVKCAQTNLVSG